MPHFALKVDHKLSLPLGVINHSRTQTKVDENSLSTSKKTKKMHVQENVKALEAELRNQVGSCDA